jgi:hypothetical protein
MCKLNYISLGVHYPLTISCILECHSLDDACSADASGINFLILDNGCCCVILLLPCHFTVLFTQDQWLLCIIYTKCMKWPHNEVLSVRLHISSLKPNIFCFIQMPCDFNSSPYSIIITTIHGSQFLFLKNYSAYKKLILI